WPSRTSYRKGRSDRIGGVVVSNEQAASVRLQFVQIAAGAVPGPFDCWLCLRGIKTLALRMERHNQSASAIAEWLAGQSKLKRVFYPGLNSHPGHELHKRQASVLGGMIAFDTGSLERGAHFLRRTRRFP